MPTSPLATDLPGALRTARFGRPHRALHTTGSTNAEALAWAADGAPEGALVTAEHQTAGRGRHGRSWSDAEGHSLLASLVLRPTLAPGRLGLLPLAAGLAVAEAIETMMGLDACLKWPNDVQLGTRKVAGLLLESHLLPGATTVVLGLGVNVGPSSFPPEITERATSLLLESGQPVPRAPLLAAILDRLEVHYEALHQDGEAELLASFQARMVGLGDTVRVSFPHTERSPIAGTIRGLAPSGALQLQAPDGLHLLHAGEITIDRDS